MSKKLSRILALVLAVSISFNSFPLAAFATDSNSVGSGDIVIEQIVQDVVNAEEAADTPDETVTVTPDKTPSDPAADTPDETVTVTPDKTPSDPAADTPDETVTVTPDKTPSDPAADTPDEPVTVTPADTTDTPADKTVRDDTESDDLGIAPQADDGTVYVLAGSDFQPTDSDHSTGVSLVNRILGKIDDKYTKMDGFLFMGDYYYQYNASASTAGKQALQSAVESVYGTSMSEVYVQGNHDDDSLVGPVLSNSGANDTADYGVFVINEKDYMWRNDDEATIKKTAENLKTYLDAKRTQNYTKPIFVVSHLPLHYCMRTQVGGGDGMHANYIFDVLNEAGNAGLNIIFMYGHNHSHGWDDPYGGASVFLKAGDKINIAQNSTKVYKEETLAFTYLNAGFVGYYENVNSGAECDLSMTVFAITNDSVTVERYTDEGLQPLKSAGVANTNAYNEYGVTEPYLPDTSVQNSPFTINLSKTVTAPETPEPTPTPTPEPTPTPTPTDRTYTRVTDMGELVSGDKYLIIENSSTDYFMLPESTTKGSGSDARVGFDVESTTIAGGDTITGDYSAKEWTMTGSGNNWTLSTDSGKAYITNQDGTRAEAVISSSNSTTFTLGGSADSFTFNTSIGGKTYTFDHSTKGVINAYVKTATTKFYIYRMTSEGIVEQTVSANGVAVTAPGITGINVTVDNTNPDPQTYSAYISYDINPTGYTQGDTATVEIEVDPSFNINRPVKVIDKVKGTVTETTIIGGVVTFTTDHFSTYDLAQARRSVTTSGGGWVTINTPIVGGTRYVYELDTNGVDTGVEYLIVANDYAKALSRAASSNNSVDIELDGNYAYADSDTYGWTFTKNSDGKYYIRLNGQTYLRTKDGRLSSDDKPGDKRRWTVTSKGNGQYDIKRSDYNLRWSNSNSKFQVSESNQGPVKLYKYVKTENITQQAGLYAKITGELTYNVPIGTSAEAALNAVKAGITGYKYNASSMPGASVTGTALDDSELVWTLDPSYDGVTPGDYAVTISYNGKTLGTAKVVVPQRVIVSTTLESLEGTVEKGSSLTAQTGAYIVVNYEDGGAPSRVPVTLGMLKNADGTQATAMTRGDYPNLKVVYNGNTLTEAFTLHVVGRSGNNFPEYPNEGAVKVNKTATGIDFQSTGIAQVEISASGVPVKKGADVVVVIDTSSSMGTAVPDTSKSRIQVLSESLSSMLTQFKTPGEDGELPDVDIAIIDFNGYYPEDSAEDFDKISFTGSYRKNTDRAQLFTGPNAEGYIKTVGLHATDFVNVEDITPAAIAGHFTDDTLKSGTNYDGALENAYNLLAAKKAANTVERDQYVIFLSDGAPFRYNGMNNDAGQTYNKWSEWLDGKWASRADFETEYPNASYSYFYNPSGTTNNGQPHRYAEAIKGSASSTFEVISRDARGNNPAYITSVNGLGATIYSIGFGLADDKNGDSDKVSVATQQRLIQVISSGDGYNYPDVHTASALKDVFTKIVKEINYAATNARFVDQMGTNFNLQTKTVSYTLPGGTSKTITPQIEIISYDIYSAADAANNFIPRGKNIGDRKGTSTVVETVTFTTDKDGNLTGAYSDQVGGGKTNILADGTKAGYVKGVIYAKNFIYNTNAEAVEVNKVVIPSKGTGGTTTNSTTAMLPAETFYWNLGTVKTTELAMRYYVYLDGSMEGTLPAGSYATNNFATLYYDNYLENPVYKDTVSPVVAWKSANVSYAFYLVNNEGQIIVNQTTGQTGTFAHKIAVTVPVVYKEVLLNSDGGNVEARIVANDNDVLPKYYDLYDDSASYTVTVNSNGTGRWEIIKAADKEATTYVTNYNISDSSAYSNNTNESGVGNDYTHTTVWFAVVWEPQAHPDTVVIDYGLPVDINVLSNDMFGEKGKLAAIGPCTAEVESLIGGTVSQLTLAKDFGASYTGTFGSAAANTDTGFVRYTPTSMSMSTYEKFAYAVYFNDTITDGAKSGYYYDTITVIPATSVYYEDSFVGVKSFTYNNGWQEVTTDSPNYVWSQVGTTADKTQAEDRPGGYSTVDANNIYGYDLAYSEMSTFSLGSAWKASVDYDNYGRAEFNFCGTGFDIISMTNSTTGTIYVDVYKDNALVSGKSYIVDTYYGYKQVSVPGDANGDGVIADDETVLEWQPDPNATGSIYQVPVIKVSGLPYGNYTAKITVFYSPAYDNVEGSTGYDFYLDAVRIYDPTNNGTADGSTDTTIEDAYLLDGEAWPSYFELRNGLINASTFGESYSNPKREINGLVFIDGNGSVNSNQLSDYVSYGPNNEVYLAPGQSIAFKLDTDVKDKDGKNIVANIHLGVKSADGNADVNPVKFTIANVNEEGFYGTKTETINTSTDMYHDITGYKDGIIVITNTGDSGIISLTNVKSTYTEKPNSDSVNVPAQPENHQEQPGTWSRVRLYMTPAAANLALSALNKGLPVENTSGSDAEITPVPAPTPDVTPNPNPDGGSTQTPGSTDTTAPTVPDVKPDTDTMPDEDVTPPTDSGDTDGTTADGEDTDVEPGESEEETESSEDNTNPIVKFIMGIVNAVVNFFRNLFGKKS